MYFENPKPLAVSILTFPFIKFHASKILIWIQTFSWISLCRWIPHDNIAENIMSMYCWILHIPFAKEFSTAANPTFSMTLWKALGEERVILHKAYKSEKKKKRN